MILREATIKYSGNDPDKLSKSSHIRVCVSCDNCGRVNWVIFKQVKNLCRKCCQIGKHSHITGKNHHWYGKHHSDKTKKKMSDAQSGNKNHMHKTRGKYNQSRNKIVSDETKAKISKNHADVSGENNPMYGLTGELSPNFGKRGEGTGMFGKHHTIEANIKRSCTYRGIDIKDFTGFTKNIRDYVLREHKCIKLNERFKGSEMHHITKSIVIYIPKELHQHIKPHNIQTGLNMGEINALAIQYLNGEL